MSNAVPRMDVPMALVVLLLDIQLQESRKLSCEFQELISQRAVCLSGARGIEAFRATEPFYYTVRLRILHGEGAANTLNYSGVLQPLEREAWLRVYRGSLECERTLPDISAKMASLNRRALFSNFEQSSC